MKFSKIPSGEITNHPYLEEIADLKNKIIDKNYQFITSVVGACSFYPGFNMIIPKTSLTQDQKDQVLPSWRVLDISN